MYGIPTPTLLPQPVGVESVAFRNSVSFAEGLASSPSHHQPQPDYLIPQDSAAFSGGMVRHVQGHLQRHVQGTRREGQEMALVGAGGARVSNEEQAGQSNASSGRSTPSKHAMGAWLSSENAVLVSIGKSTTPLESTSPLESLPQSP